MPLGERYELLAPIAHGEMATIYRGRDLQRDRVVAMKVPQSSTDEKVVRHIQRDAERVATMFHPNVVQVYDSFETEGKYYLVMELGSGADVRQYLQKKGSLDVDRTFIFGLEVARGLGALHQLGIVHGDVKPENILKLQMGVIKLTPFSITARYKEIRRPADDVYALSMVMYEMLTGRIINSQDPPLPPSQFNPNTPKALDEVILRCLEKQPEKRFQDGAALAQALERVAESP